MPGHIECENGHRTRKISLHDAAILISQNRATGECSSCDGLLRYIIDHVYANDENHRPYHFEVISAIRLWPTEQPNGYDPFLLVLRELETREETIWPVFWAPDRTKKGRYGQWSPMLRIDQWRRLFLDLYPNRFGTRPPSEDGQEAGQAAGE